MRIEASLLEAPPGRPRDDDGGDTRFRALMRAEDWASLPAPIRRRFSKRLANGATALYAGEVLETTMSRVGWLWAQLLRLIGGPLPLMRNRHVPAVVAVTEDHASRGQIWTRLYGRPGGFAQVVHSCKRFAGPTGLEEYVGYGIGMTLTVEAREGALIFRSRDYFVELFGRRWLLPTWLAPGDTIVTHAELPDGRFSFTLQLIHPRLGHMIRQMGMFREVVT
jgi:Domain of unknown function (DUF4166)